MFIANVRLTLKSSILENTGLLSKNVIISVKYITGLQRLMEYLCNKKKEGLRSKLLNKKNRAKIF